MTNLNGEFNMEKSDKVLNCIESVKDLFIERMKYNHFTTQNDFIAYLLKIEKMYTRDMDLQSINRLKKRIATIQPEDLDFVDLAIMIARFKDLPFYEETFNQVMNEKANIPANERVVITYNDQVKIYKTLIMRLLNP